MVRIRFVRWTGTCLGIAVILYLLFHYDPQAVFLPLLQSRIHLLVAVMGLLAATQLLNALTPVVLLGPPERGRLSRWARTRVFLAMQPLAMIAPARLSDFGTLPLLKSHYQPGAPASSIVMDRLITLFVLLLLTPAAVRLVWPMNSSTLLNLAVIVCLALIGSAPLLLSSQKVRNLVNRSLLRLWPTLLQGFGAHMESLLHTGRGRLLFNLFLTSLKILLAAATLTLLASNVGISLDLLTALWMSILIQLAGSPPISIQGIGVAEGSLILLFSVNGLPEASALSISLIARLLLLVVTAAIYLTTTVPLMTERLARKPPHDNGTAETL